MLIGKQWRSFSLLEDNPEQIIGSISRCVDGFVWYFRDVGETSSKEDVVKTLRFLRKKLGAKKHKYILLRDVLEKEN